MATKELNATSMAAAVEEALKKKAAKEEADMEEVHVGIAEGGETEISDDFITIKGIIGKNKKESKKDRKKREKAEKSAKNKEQREARRKAVTEEEVVADLPTIVVEQFDPSYVVGTREYNDKFLGLRQFFDKRLRDTEAMEVYGKGNYIEGENRTLYLDAVGAEIDWLSKVCLRTSDVKWMEQERTLIERRDAMQNIFNLKRHLETFSEKRLPIEKAGDIDADSFLKMSKNRTKTLLAYVKKMESIRPMELDKSSLGDRFDMFDEETRKNKVDSVNETITPESENKTTDPKSESVKSGVEYKKVVVKDDELYKTKTFKSPLTGCTYTSICADIYHNSDVARMRTPTKNRAFDVLFG